MLATKPTSAATASPMSIRFQFIAAPPSNRARAEGQDPVAKDRGNGRRNAKGHAGRLWVVQVHCWVGDQTEDEESPHQLPQITHSRSRSLLAKQLHQGEEPRQKDSPKKNK